MLGWVLPTGGFWSGGAWLGEIAIAFGWAAASPESAPHFMQKRAVKGVPQLVQNRLA